MPRNTTIISLDQRRALAQRRSVSPDKGEAPLNRRVVQCVKDPKVVAAVVAGLRLQRRAPG